MLSKNHYLKLFAPMVAIIIFILSSQSSISLPRMGIIPTDKIAHFLAFGALSLSLCFWFSLESWKEKTFKTSFIVFMLASFYGALDEIHQHFVDYRVPSISDWIADSLGALCALAVVILWVKIIKPQSKKLA